MVPGRSIFLFILVFHCFSHPIFAKTKQCEKEEFTEELLLKPLHDRNVLAHFHFNHRVPMTKTYGRHHRLFPKAIYQLVQKFYLKEMELSFTQGRWNYERWGGLDPMSNINAKPPGVELWAIFDVVSSDEVDAMWKNLTHALSGLFCASINFLEKSTTYSSPYWGFRLNTSNLRYGALPREAVCTENLTPWLKLLPCRDKSGLAEIMDRSSIYRGFYHSQRLRIISNEFSLEDEEFGIMLEQTLTLVLQPSFPRVGMDPNEGILQPSWDIKSIFGKKLTGKCTLANSSSVFLELEKGLVSELVKVETENVITRDSWNNSIFELSVIPDRMIREANGSSILYEYSVKKLNENKALDLGIKWKLPVIWPCLKAPFHASRYLIGSGNQRGSIALSLEVDTVFLLPSEQRCSIKVVVFQVVPWYVKVYFHSLQLFIDGKSQKLSEILKSMRVSPSQDKVSPGVMELELLLPCDARSASMTIDFDKGFLHIDEYPPDANQGFDIPSAVVSFPDFQSSFYFEEERRSKSPLLTRFLERNSVRSYTEVLLVPLATPDFSMPYNVITFTCTVLALYFGSLLNVLRRRVGEEKRFLQRKEAAKLGLIPQMLSKVMAKLKGRPYDSESSSSLLGSKLLKIVLVAGIAIGWHLYMGDQG